MKFFFILVLSLFSLTVFAEVKSRLGIDDTFSEFIKPSDVIAVNGICNMNDHIRKIEFEFTNFQNPPGKFGRLKYDFKAKYQLKNGGSFEFTPHINAEPVLSMGWQETGANSKSKSISAFFGTSGPESEGLVIDAHDWTSAFEFSVVSKNVTISTKNTWINFYDPKRLNDEPLTGGDCLWILKLK